MAAHTRKIIAAIVVMLVAQLVGCSDEPNTEGNAILGPDPESSGSTWEISTISPTGEEIYFARVRVSLRNSDEPEIMLARSRAPGSLAIFSVMSMEDFVAYWEAAVEVVAHQAELVEGCDAEDGQSESVFWYSGDNHDGASIAGCGAQLIEEFRELNSEFVEKYFSVEL